jgi:hypothetical protein
MQPLLTAMSVQGVPYQGFIQYHVPAALVPDLAKEVWAMAREAAGRNRIRLEYLFQGFVNEGA